MLRDPPSVRVRRDSRETDTAGCQFDEEQDVEALQEQRVDAEEVALEDARRLRAQELGPACFGAVRCRLDPRLLQDRPHCARGELDAEADQLTLDPTVAPTRVLAGEAQHKLTHVSRRCWPAGTTMRIRPTARDEFAVPAQKRRWRHEGRSPPRLSRQHPAERSQQRAVSLRQLRTSDLTLQHAQLMTQQQDLDLPLPLPLRAKAEHDKLEQPPQRPVEKRQQDPSETNRPRTTLPVQTAILRQTGRHTNP